MKYLHQVGRHVSWIDHRVLPEVRAMFAAMMSRVPQGGIAARYDEVVEQIARGTFPSYPANRDNDIQRALAEEALCTYGGYYGTDEHDEDIPYEGLHPVIQEFFDKFVGDYGHASIKELTGSPTIFVEHISWWFAYLTFDNPLVKGQEMSTRAVWRKDWAMASDAMIVGSPSTTLGDYAVSAQVLEMHELGLEIAKHEIEAWKVELRRPCEECDGHGYLPGTGPDGEPSGVGCRYCGGDLAKQGTGKKYPWMNDPQAFRPAFDRARWALPGTIETGVSHCADVRTMGRVIKVMEDLAIASGHRHALEVLEEVKEGYRQALPGMAGMWLKEAMHSDDTCSRCGWGQDTDGDGNCPACAHVSDEEAARMLVASVRKDLPGHINMLGPGMTPIYAGLRPDSWVNTRTNRGRHDFEMASPRQRSSTREYVDPYFNHHTTVLTGIQPSLAAARDWHRHRSMMPWRLRVVRAEIELMDQMTGEFYRPNPPVDGGLVIDHHYKPISEFGKAHTSRYLRLCTKLHDQYMSVGNQWMAMCCLPLGTRVEMVGQGGLQHGLYMLELRGYVAGGNFEYKEQAQSMLKELHREVREDHVKKRARLVLPEE